jgi:hypothetical protein
MPTASSNGLTMGAMNSFRRSNKTRTSEVLSRPNLNRGLCLPNRAVLVRSWSARGTSSDLFLGALQFTSRLLAIALLVTLSACTFTTTKPDDAESVKYVNWVTSGLLSSWDYSFFRDQATPELLSQLDRKKFVRLHDEIRRALGETVKYTEAHGVTRFLSIPHEGVSEMAEYTSTAEFAHGIGTVYVTAVKLNGHWRLNGFYIHVE